MNEEALLKAAIKLETSGFKVSSKALDYVMAGKAMDFASQFRNDNVHLMSGIRVPAEV